MSTLVTTTAQIGTIKDATGNATAMTIDSTGRVSQPNKPAFHVFRNTASGGAGVNGVVAWNNAKINVGTMTNLSTGITTIPVTGLYHLYFHALGTNSSGGGQADDLHIRIETSPAGGGSYTSHMIGLGDHSTIGSSGGYISVSAAVTLSLSATDLVRFNVTYGYIYIDNTNNPYSYAGGFFLG